MKLFNDSYSIAKEKIFEFFKELFKHKHKFEVVRTLFPYNPGYGVYCEGCKMVVDTGLSKEQANHEAGILNQRKK